MVESFAFLAEIYGWTHDAISRLTTRQFFLYLNQAHKLEARRQKLRFEAASYPHIKKGDRMRIDKHYDKIISPPQMPSREETKLSWSILKKRAKKKKKGS